MVVEAPHQLADDLHGLLLRLEGMHTLFNLCTYMDDTARLCVCVEHNGNIAALSR